MLYKLKTLLLVILLIFFASELLADNCKEPTPSMIKDIEKNIGIDVVDQEKYFLKISTGPVMNRALV